MGDMGVSQSSVSRVIISPLDSLSSDRMVQRFIKFPMQANQIRDNQEKFFQIAGFPGTVGAIDGTHIQIIAPNVNENEFVTRHHYHSINVQVVFDARVRVLMMYSGQVAGFHP